MTNETNGAGGQETLDEGPDNLVHVPEGSFLMGSTDQDLENMLIICPECERDRILGQQPQWEIYLDSFWIDKTEVTNHQFSQFISETMYVTTAEEEGKSYLWITDDQKEYITGAN